MCSWLAYPYLALNETDLRFTINAGWVTRTSPSPEAASRGRVTNSGKAHQITNYRCGADPGNQTGARKIRARRCPRIRDARHVALRRRRSTEGLTAWSLGQRGARLILNPWADRPIPGLDLAVDRYEQDGDRLARRDGKSLREVYDLPVRRPEDV
jgi:hypothetical protein